MTQATETQKHTPGTREFYMNKVEGMNNKELLDEAEKLAIRIDGEGFGGSETAKDMRTMVRSVLMSRMSN